MAMTRKDQNPTRIPERGRRAAITETGSTPLPMPGVFLRFWLLGLTEYDWLEGMGWRWQATDGAMSKAHSGGKNSQELHRPGQAEGQAERPDSCVAGALSGQGLQQRGRRALAAGYGYGRLKARRWGGGAIAQVAE